MTLATSVGWLACLGPTVLVGLVAPEAKGKVRSREIADTSAVDSILSSPAVTWDLRDLHPSIRNRVHLTSRKTPAFPFEDPKLVDPHQWPQVMLIKGQPCSLLISTGESDAMWFVSSLDKVKAGAAYSLYYSATRNRPHLRHGPFYCWTGQGSLVERAWRGGDNLRTEVYDYLYYPSGELHRFEYITEGPEGMQGAFELLDERFARDGTLIGWKYRSGSIDTVDATYWLGQPVSDHEFQDRAGEALMRAMRNPTRADSTR